MKVGLSVYSLKPEFQKGMTIEEAFAWTKENGGDFVELVSFVTDFKSDPNLIERALEASRKYDLPMLTYCTPGDVCGKTEEEFAEAIAGLKEHIDIAHRLGVKTVRHDLSSFRRLVEENTIEYYDKDLPRIIQACQELCDHAAQYGIVVTVENHGFYINGGDRVRRLMLAVDRENFGCTLDVGNSLCVDEDPYVCVCTLLPFVKAVHYKDFIVRTCNELMGEDELWFRSNHGRYLKGTIVGQGEIDLRSITEKIKASGYDKTVTVEYEGMEDCKLGSRQGMANVRKLFGL